MKHPLFADNTAFYAFVEVLIANLEAAGLPVAAADVMYALRSGCTSGEIFNDLQIAMERTRAENASALPEALRGDIETALTALAAASTH